MSMYGSQQGLNMSRRAASKGDLTGGGTYHYSRSEILQGSGNGYDPYTDGYKTYSYSKTSTGGLGGGMASGMMSGMGGGMVSGTMSGMGSGMVSGTMSGMRYVFIFGSFYCALLPVTCCPTAFKQDP